MKIKTLIIQYTIFIFCLISAVVSAKYKRKKTYLSRSLYHRQHPRIRNGIEAVLGQFPFYAALENNKRKTFCGGSIITNYHILTAAHCLVIKQKERFGEKKDPSQLFVSTGSTHRTGKNGQRYCVDDTFVHPHYTRAKEYYAHFDIGILKLVKPIEFNENVQPISLSPYLVRDKTLIVVGFGRLDNNTFPIKLQYTILPPIEEVESLSRAKGSFRIYSPWNGHCSGDSGGPLVAETAPYTQIGLVTGGNHKNCTKVYYLDFQDVSYHSCWLKNVLETS